MLQFRMRRTVGLSISDPDTHLRGSSIVLRIVLRIMNVNVHRVQYTNFSNVREWIKQKSR